MHRVTRGEAALSRGQTGAGLARHWPDARVSARRDRCGGSPAGSFGFDRLLCTGGPARL